MDGLLNRVSLVALTVFLPSLAAGQASAQIDEVVVTATKRAAISAQDVAVSLKALGEDDLEARGADDFSSYAEGLGGLSFADRGPGQQLIAIRGVNASTTVVNTDEPEAQAAVGVYIDEVPVSLTGYNPDLKLFDVNRVEVLRGPQGTLFGAGSMSGTIRIITNEPDLSDFAGKTSLTYSSTNEGGNNYGINGMVNVPLVEDVLALRITGWGKREGGFIDNVAALSDARHPLFGTGTDLSSVVDDVNTEDTYGGRIQLKFAPSESFDATLKVFRQETELGGSQSEDTFAASEPRPGNNTADATLGDYQQSRVFDEPYDDEFTIYSLELDWDVGFANITSVTSYLDRFQTNGIEQTDFFQAVFGPDFAVTSGVLINSTDVEDFVQEFRIAGSSFEDRVDWLFGAFYNVQDKTFIQDAPTRDLTAGSVSAGAVDICDFLAALDCATLSGITGYPIDPENIFESTSDFKTTQLAFFGEVGVDLTDKIKVIAGARYFDYEQDFEFYDIGGIFSAGVTIDTTLKEDGWNPKVSLEVRPADDVLVYATAARGFRLGGNNDPVPVSLCGTTSPTFTSDSLWTYELGGKSTLQERFQVNGAVYYTDWSDVPVADPLNGCGFKQSTNAGSARIMGIEGDITAALTDQFTLSLSASYTDAEFTEDVAGLTTPLVASEGDRLPIVPEYVLGANAFYTFPIPSKEAFDGFFTTDFSYRSSQFNDVKTAGGVELDGYYNVNAKAGLQGEDWSASVFVTNLTNERNVIFKDTIFLLHNRDSVSTPRTIGVNFIKDF